mmetsp:Transcript_34147/g.79681  ORF Transcript_34147/g.79681 Transcript_34147/m.79681 type:complete len:205 (+) Transcript_34147:678-1292(+)
MLDLAPITLAMEESTQMCTRAPPPLQVSANQGAEIVRVVQLLLGPVRKWAPWTKRTSLRVCQARLLLVPVGAELMAVAQRRWTPHVLVRVRVHAGLPVMLRSNRAPHGLELLSEEFDRQRLRGRCLLLWCQQRRSDLSARMRERATDPVTAPGDVRVCSAVALLLLRHASAVAGGILPRLRHQPRHRLAEGHLPLLKVLVELGC